MAILLNLTEAEDFSVLVDDDFNAFEPDSHVAGDVTSSTLTQALRAVSSGRVWAPDLD